jgi:hypothetical protein
MMKRLYMHNPTAVVLSLLAFSGTAAFCTEAAAQDAPAAVPPPAAAAAPASAIQIVQPFNKAVVRESVPIKLREFPKHGYVSVSIDGKFITAQALPKNPSLPVYVWDTKASYTDPGSPDTPKFYSDGPHALTIVVYNDQNKLVGQDSVSVQVADKINMPASEGIKMAYPWKTGLTLRYQRRTTLTAMPTEASATTPAQVIQESLLRFERSVENSSGGSSLIRDSIIPVDKSVRPKAFVSYVATHGQAQALTSGVHAEYREVDNRGQVLSKLASENTPQSIGFSIPVLPPRRVSVGAHWESPVQITLDWTSPYPATVTATSTLEDFEWQDRYPTAKIRETYEGPATFYPGPGSALPSIASREIKFERIIYFAYNAGRVVRTQTTLSLTSSDPGLQSLSSPTGGPGGFNGPGGSNGRGGFNGPGRFNGPGEFNRQQGGPGYPGEQGGNYPGYPEGGRGEEAGGEGGPGASPEGYPGAPPGEFSGGGSPGPGGYPGGGYPGGPPNEYGGPGGYPGAAGLGSPTKLNFSESAVLLT